MMEKEVKAEFVVGNRKNKLAKVEGHLFEKNKNILLGESYRCLQYKSCKARLHVLDHGSFLKSEHNHPPCPEKIKAREIVAQGKSVAKQSLLAKNSEMVERVMKLAGESNLDAAYLGPTENLKRTFRRVKLTTHGHSNIGNSLGELELPQTLQITTRGDRFLLHDNNGDHNRMFIFASDDSLDKLAYCQTWLIDGTFKTCPRLFAQIYTIHGLYQNRVAVPFVYAYLPGKSEALYAEFFRRVRRSVDGEPQYIISDFELGAINACRDQFVATEMSGCLFHLTQSIFRHVQGLPSVYERYMSHDADGSKVRKAVRSLGALSLVRPAELIGAFYDLRGQFPMNDPVREIFSYFQENYLGYTWDDVRFPISFWNVRSRFENNIPRTNNAKEGWHFRFNNLHSKAHPTVQHSIEMIKKEENNWHHEFQVMKGGYLPSRRKKSVQIDRRLREILAGEDAQAYSNKIEFLGAVQQCLHDFLKE